MAKILRKQKGGKTTIRRTSLGYLIRYPSEEIEEAVSYSCGGSGRTTLDSSFDKAQKNLKASKGTYTKTEVKRAKTYRLVAEEVV